MMSDKSLLNVAIVLFVLSAGWLLMSYVGVTGFVATDTATVNVSITSTANINFTTDNINFGTGVVSSGGTQAVLDTSAGTTAGGTGFTPNSAGLILQNIGNVNVSVTLEGSDVATFIGGTSPAYKYNVSNGGGAEAGSCVAGIDQGAWQDVNSTSPGTLICSPLQNLQASDTVRIDIQLTIPKDSKTGALSDTLTATATAM